MTAATLVHALRRGLAARFAVTLLAAVAAVVPPAGVAIASAAAHPAASAPRLDREVAPTDDPLPGLEAVDEIRRRLDTVKALESPTDEDKARIDRLTQALEALARAQANRERAADLRDLVAQLPSRLERARTPMPPPAVPEEGATLEQREQALKVATADVAAAREALAQVDAQSAQLAERRRLLPDELARARGQLVDLTQAAEAAAPGPAGSPDSVRQLALALVAEQRSTVALLEAELASLDARGQLLGAQRSAAQARLDTAEAVADRIRSELDRQRDALAREAEAAAKDRTSERPGSPDPAIVDATAENARVAQALREAGQRLNRVAEETRLLESELSRIERDFRVDQERARVAGTTGGLSAVLRSQRRALPSLRRIAASTAEHREARTNVDLARIDWGVELDALVARERALPDTPENAPLRAVLAERREKLLVPLLRTLDSLSTDLASLESLDMRLAEAVSAYRDFIDERILWARSGAPLWASAKGAVEAAAGVVSRHFGTIYGWRALWRPLREAPFPAVAGLAVAAALLATRPLQRRWLERLAAAVSRGSSDRFVLTLEALVATLLLAMAVPAAMTGMAVSLRSNELAAPFAAAVGTTLLRGAVCMALLMFTCRLVQRQGLAVEHFGWPREQVALLHRVTTRLLWIGMPFVIAAMLFSRLAETGAFAVDPAASAGAVAGGEASAALRATADSLRAAASLVSLPFLVLLIWASWRVFHPTRGVFGRQLSPESGAWVASLRHLWCAAIVAVPAAALLLAALGWGYTAGVLVTKFVFSAAIALGVVVFEAILLRAREFAARAFATRSREQLLDAPAPIEGVDAVQKHEVRSEVAALSRKTGTTIRGAAKVLLLGGLVLVWSDLLPALRVLDGVALWQGADGPVTLAHLIWAVLIGAISGFAARNVPGALEVLVLQHTGMSAAARYAAGAVIGYGIVIVGVMATASKLGLAWHSVQWLVAAVGVGLGFGLQDIVGNFVAGLIVLLEQPVRVGDVVTVGDRTGQVVKIRIRSTTLRDGDGKDLILPNKHLITERVLNWTLSGAPLRIVIPVGVPLGTDLALAEKLLAEAARRVPGVLQTPAPSAMLIGFGKGSIDFEVRAFVPRIDQLGAARHALTLAIRNAFADAGLGIALPQLDIHVDPASLERVVKEVAR